MVDRAQCTPWHPRAVMRELACWASGGPILKMAWPGLGVGGNTSHFSLQGTRSHHAKSAQVRDGGNLGVLWASEAHAKNHCSATVRKSQSPSDCDNCHCFLIFLSTKLEGTQGGGGG